MVQWQNVAVGKLWLAFLVYLTNQSGLISVREGMILEFNVQSIG